MRDQDLLHAAVREAGALAKRFYVEGAKSWDKRPDDPVTEADLAVDRLLHDRLIGGRPDYGWLSEESVDDKTRLAARRVWVVDPIDGTRAFVERRPEFCVSVALVEDGAPVLAAVFNPITDEYFAAARGEGARLNDAPLRASAADTLTGARFLAGGRRHFKSGPWAEAAPGASYDYRNSIAYRMVLVAADRFEAAISLSEKSDWDIAAACLIVTEAGGRATTRDGADFVFNRPEIRHPSVIATAPAVHDAILKLLRELPGKG